MGLLAVLDRFNRAHPWSHNDAFAGYVLRHAQAVRRSGGDVAVNVGCGTGNLVERLAMVFPRVVGVEPDHDTAAFAARRFERSAAIAIEHRPFGDEPEGSYDLIVFVASLHHRPLAPTLRHARQTLRPGGRIVIVGVARETREDALRSWLSLLLNPLIGLARHPRRAARLPEEMRAPTAPAAESFDEFRDVGRELLPGIRARRRLFWRYTAVWTRPG